MLIRIEFSERVNHETLRTLHASGLTGALPPELKQLLSAADVEWIAPVYQMTPQDLMNDSYGFARTFQAQIRADRDPEDAMRTLRASPLVARVVAVTMKRTMPR